MRKYCYLYLIIFLSLFVHCLDGRLYSLSFEPTPEWEDGLHIISGDYVNLREKPSLDSKVIKQLRITSRVKVLRSSEEKIDIKGESGHWVYVASTTYQNEKGENLRGWVFDTYIADVSQFNKIDSFKNLSLCGWLTGDAEVNYTFLPDGSFYSLVIDKDAYGKNISEQKVYGKLYQFKKVVLGLYDGTSFYVAFYLSDDKNICIVHPIYLDKNICGCVKPK
jgi:uncharacterized protein YgiM (DUF1202 family)